MTWWAWYTAGVITGWVTSPITWLVVGAVALFFLVIMAQNSTRGKK